MTQFNISPDEVAKLEEKFEIKSNERKLKNFLKTKRCVLQSAEENT